MIKKLICKVLILRIWIQLLIRINNTVWHHFAAVQSGKSVRLYVDGQEKLSTGQAEIYNGGYSVNRVWIGALPWDIKPDGFYHAGRGEIDDIRIYNRDLSGSEIQDIYNEGGGTCSYTDSDNDGVIDLLDKCSDTPSGSYTDKNGCPASGLYTQEQVNKIIAAVLLWGDIDGDKKISLPEAVHALQVTSGITEPAIK